MLSNIIIIKLNYQEHNVNIINYDHIKVRLCIYQIGIFHVGDNGNNLIIKSKQFVFFT